MKIKLTHEEKLKHMALVSIECGTIVRPVYGFEKDVIGFVVTDEKPIIRKLKKCQKLKS